MMQPGDSQDPAQVHNKAKVWRNVGETNITKECDDDRTFRRQWLYKCTL